MPHRLTASARVLPASAVVSRCPFGVRDVRGGRVVELFGRFEIGATAAFVAACFLVVYGAYFAITYLFARRFTRE